MTARAGLVVLGVIGAGYSLVLAMIATMRIGSAPDKDVGGFAGGSPPTDDAARHRRP